MEHTTESNKGGFLTKLYNSLERVLDHVKIVSADDFEQTPAWQNIGNEEDQTYLL